MTGNLFVILEYCRYGSLREYLINHRKNFVNQLVKNVDECRRELKEHNGLNGRRLDSYHAENRGRTMSSSSIGGTIITTSDLINWSFQIARGMNFLARKNVLHGDLTAHNVLLSEEGVVKLANVGQERQLYSEENYQHQSEHVR
jgi:serine/threonine protein kinase